jgi:hypothetical protein
MRTEAPGRRRDGPLRFVLSMRAHLPANAALKTRARSRSFPAASARPAVSRSSSRKFVLASHQGPFPHHGLAAPAGSAPLSCSSAQVGTGGTFKTIRQEKTFDGPEVPGPWRGNPYTSHWPRSLHSGISPARDHGPRSGRCTPSAWHNLPFRLVSRFRSSQTLAAASDANFGIKGTLATL